MPIVWGNWLGTCFKRITTDVHNKPEQLPRMPRNLFRGGEDGASGGYCDGTEVGLGACEAAFWGAHSSNLHMKCTHKLDITKKFI